MNFYNSDEESILLDKWTHSLSIVPVKESKSEESAYKGVGNSTSISDDDDAHTLFTNSDEKSNASTQSSSSIGTEINILSFNVLAESYLTPRSHKKLPECYAEVVFDKSKRRDLLRSILIKLASQFDVLCLQEVDNLIFPMIEECLTQKLDFGYVYSPRNKNEKPNVSNDHSSERSSSENAGNNESFNIDERNIVKNGKKTNKKDSRSDGCATFYNRKKWKCIDYQVVQFDDLADESRPPLHSTHDDFQPSKDTEHPMKMNLENDDPQTVQNPNSNQQQHLKQPKAKHAIPGIISSYQRRNTALIIRLQSKVTSKHPLQRKEKKSQEIVIGNAHLYWHPGYEFVKLSQAHYLLHKIKQFAIIRHDDKDKSEHSRNQTTPIIVCGDMNSKPNSVVHQYFTKGHVDARTVAPWYHKYNPELGKNQFDNDDELNQDPIFGINEDDDADEESTSKNNNVQTQDVKKDNDGDSISLSLSVMDLNESSSTIDGGLKPLETKPVQQTKRIPSYEEDDNEDSSTTPKYLLDITLNKLTRWLRIMGLDAELENEKEEKARTGDGKMYVLAG